jgi:hypothetical protein
MTVIFLKRLNNMLKKCVKLIKWLIILISIKYGKITSEINLKIIYDNNYILNYYDIMFW